VQAVARPINGQSKRRSPEKMYSSTLHDAFLDELRDLYNLEKHLTHALPRMASAATAASLADTFESHLQETIRHIDRLEQLFSVFGEETQDAKCECALDNPEASEIINDEFDEPTSDAMLIAAAQRIEHYEIATYGTAIAWAEAMGHVEAASLLQETLAEEKAVDTQLTRLATGGINQAAAIAHAAAAKEEVSERWT
jgi:ferritin-like metal-binding protein YciE